MKIERFRERFEAAFPPSKRDFPTRSFEFRLPRPGFLKRYGIRQFYLFEPFRDVEGFVSMKTGGQTMEKKWLMCSVFIGLMVVGTLSAQAKVPHLIRYQGTVTDKTGVPLEGPYTPTFRIYDAETAGNKLWEEVQPDVPIAKGVFSVFLGGITPLDLAFDKDLWLSIQVATDPEMTPRIRLSSVPTAYRAEKAEALANPITTSTINDDSNRLVPSGAIILWTGSSCPAGYTRVSAMDGKFLVSSSTYNPVSGGSNTHSHSGGPFSGTTSNESDNTYLSVQSGYPNDRIAGGDGTAPVRHWSHTHTYSGSTGSTGSADSRPEFATVLLCKKD